MPDSKILEIIAWILWGGAAAALLFAMISYAGAPDEMWIQPLTLFSLTLSNLAQGAMVGSRMRRKRENGTR